MAKLTINFKRETYKLSEVLEGSFFQIVDKRWDAELQKEWHRRCLWERKTEKTLSPSDAVFIMNYNYNGYAFFCPLECPTSMNSWKRLPSDFNLEVVILPKGSIITIEV